MLTDGIKFKNFKRTKKITRKKFISSINENEIIKSLTKSYEYSYKKKFLKKFYKFSNFRVIGMGGSSLGAQAIYDFLRHKIKKKFEFVSNLQPSFKENKKKYVNLVISKSGNTTETIVNSNILIKKKDKNIFITENKKSYLLDLATKLKSDIIDHNNYIGYKKYRRQIKFFAEIEVNPHAIYNNPIQPVVDKFSGNHPSNNQCANCSKRV